MLFTNTDSLTYEIKSEHVYEEFSEHKHLFHFSNYPKDWELFDPVNEIVIGKMKDVPEGKIDDESVELKSKMHFMEKMMVKNLTRQKE